MNRIALMCAFLGAGLASVAEAEVHGQEMFELKLASPPPAQSPDSTIGIPVISIAAFEMKFCTVPVDSRPAIISAYLPVSSFVQGNSDARWQLCSIDGSDVPSPSLASSISLISARPLPLDAGATTTLQEGDVIFDAVRAMPLGLFSSR